MISDHMIHSFFNGSPQKKIAAEKPNPPSHTSLYLRMTLLPRDSIFPMKITIDGSNGSNYNP